MAASLLENERDTVLFVGTPDGAEARLVPESGVSFFALRARGYDRAHPLTLLTASMTILASTFRAISLIRRERPDVVIGFGGYVSLPVGFAAVLTRTPLVLHEQNSVPGLANRVLSRWARAVGVTYECSADWLRHPDRAKLTGNPVRAAVLEADRTAGRSAFGVAPDEVLMLVFGGSRGARHINSTMVASAVDLVAEESVRVVHVAGHQEEAETRASLEPSVVGAGRYEVVDYLDDMGTAIAAADLVLARAGATSIAEITAIGRAAIYVPYPYATDDHQTLNARTLEDAGAGIVIPDAELDEPRFFETVRGLLQEREHRATMAAASKALGRPHATGSLIDLVRESAAPSLVKRS